MRTCEAMKKLPGTCRSHLGIILVMRYKGPGEEAKLLHWLTVNHELAI